MTVAIIAHVEDDRAYVEALTRALPTVRFVACALDPVGPPLAFDPRLPLVLVWSERAARTRATRAFAALIRTHGGEAILCAADRHAAPKEFERLNCAKVDGAPGSGFFPGGLAAAIAAARHRAKAMEEEEEERLAAPAFSPSAFAGSFGGGLVKGIAGGAALFGAAAAAPVVMDVIAVHQTAQPVDETFSVMNVTAAVDERAAPFDTLPGDALAGAHSYPAGFATHEPPEELVRLAQQVLDEADVPMASTARAEQVARKAHQSFGERPLRALAQVNEPIAAQIADQLRGQSEFGIDEIWSPDPNVAAPLEAFAAAPVLELTDEIGPEEELWDGPSDRPISTSSFGFARALT